MQYERTIPETVRVKLSSVLSDGKMNSDVEFGMREALHVNLPSSVLSSGLILNRSVILSELSNCLNSFLLSFPKLKLSCFWREEGVSIPIPLN